MPDSLDWLSPLTAPAPHEVLAAELDRLDAEPQPDAHGRVRVRDLDTGHAITVAAHLVGRGRYVVLDEPASDPITGLPIPPEHNRFPVEPITTSGQEAENQEQANG